MSPLPDHVLIRPLLQNDVDEVVKLESRSLPSNERACRDKILYRIKVAPELSLGIFVRKTKKCKKTHSRTDSSSSSESLTSAPSCTRFSEKLIGFVIAVKTPTKLITDDAFLIPSSENRSSAGHLETGSTIAIVAFCVDSEYRGKKLGTTLLRDFVQRVATQVVAERVSLLATDGMVPFYERLGFLDAGESAVKLGSGVWHDMYIDLGE